MMRLHVYTGAALALLLAACTSNSRIDALDVPRPSLDTTSSIRPANPIPAAGISAAHADAGQEEFAATQAVAPVQARPASIQAVERLEETSPAPVDIAMTMPDDPAPRKRRLAEQEIHSSKFRDAKPIHFGRASPKQYQVHGVDVSRWQGDINWEKLRTRGANFAFIKATDGGDHVDPAFRRNWNAAAAAGVPRGAYHFFYWCRNADQQAKWFMRNVPKTAGALPPVIDVEWSHSKSCKKRPARAIVLKKMQSFMDALEAHYGQRPIIYTAPDFYEDNLQGAFQDYPFWLRAVAEHPSKVYPGRDWVFWQYSGTGKSQGVGEQIDLNVFNGNDERWHRWLETRLH